MLGTPNDHTSRFPPNHDQLNQRYLWGTNVLDNLPYDQGSLLVRYSNHIFPWMLVTLVC